MRRLLFGGLVLALGVVSTAASAIDDPIASRKKLMQANGGAAGLMQAMIKGEMPFSAPAAQSALRTFNAVAYSVGNFFPAGSDQGDTKASPKIWEDMADFKARFEKFGKDAKAAEASVKNLDDLKAAIGKMGKEDCGGCHEVYRLKKS